MAISGEAKQSEFLSGKDKLSKETHVSFNAIVKFSGRWEDTEDEWESSTERGVRAENRNPKKKKKRKRQAAGQYNKDSAGRHVRQRDGREGQVRKVNWEKQWVTGSPEWIGCENKEGLKHCSEHWVPRSSFPWTHTQLQNPFLHTFSPSSFTRVNNKHSASIFKGVVEAAGIHSNEHNKARRLWEHEARNNKENKLNTPNEG